MTEATTEIPAGFSPIFRTSPFLESIGPLYSRGAGADLVIGLRVQEKHANGRGFAHGGVLATIADVALGYSLATLTEPLTSAVTVNLSLDFTGRARVGDWLETRVDFQKLGTRMAFANAYLSVNSEPVARASGAFLMRGQGSKD